MSDSQNNSGVDFFSANPIPATPGTGASSVDMFDNTAPGAPEPASNSNQNLSSDVQLDDYADDPVDGADEGEEDADESEVPEIEAKDKSEKSDEDKKVEAPKGKSYKLLDAEGKPVAVPQDAEIAINLDGKKTKIPIKELVSNYNGKVVYERKFNELDKDKKEYIKEKSNIRESVELVNGHIQEFFSLAKTPGKEMEALDQLAILSGINPKEFVKNFRDNLYRQAYQYFTLDEEQRKAYDRDQELLLDKRQTERTRRQIETEQAQVKREQVKLQTIQKTGMSYDDYQDIEKRFQESVHKKELDSKDITPELIAQTHQQARAYKYASEILKEFDPKIDAQDDGNLDLVFSIYQNHPDITREEAISMLKRADSLARARNVSKKITKAPTKVAASHAQPKQQQVKELSKEDLFLE